MTFLTITYIESYSICSSQCRAWCQGKRIREVRDRLWDLVTEHGHFVDEVPGIAVRVEPRSARSMTPSGGAGLVVFLIGGESPRPQLVPQFAVEMAVAGADDQGIPYAAAGDLAIPVEGGGQGDDVGD